MHVRIHAKWRCQWLTRRCAWQDSYWSGPQILLPRRKSLGVSHHPPRKPVLDFQERGCWCCFLVSVLTLIKSRSATQRSLRNLKVTTFCRYPCSLMIRADLIHLTGLTECSQPIGSLSWSKIKPRSWPTPAATLRGRVLSACWVVLGIGFGIRPIGKALVGNGDGNRASTLLNISGRSVGLRDDRDRGGAVTTTRRASCATTSI